MINYRWLLTTWLIAGSIVLLNPAQTEAATTVSGNIITDTIWTTAGSPYVIESSVTLASGNTLTIEPGVVVKLFGWYTSFTVNGTLIAEGTATDPIIFTSLQDDNYGGDTNGDGNTTNPTPGDWLQIYFASASTATLSHALVQYGGHDHGNWMIKISSNDVIISDSNFSNNYPYDAAMLVDATATIINNSFNANETTALYSTSGNSSITGNVITGCSDGSGIAINTGSPVVDHNTIDGCLIGLFTSGADAQPFLTNNILTDNGVGIVVYNSSIPLAISSNSMTGSLYGLQNFTTTNTINAESNWWGDASGPYHVSLNSTGLGTAVTDGVDFDPWLTTDPNVDATAETSELEPWQSTDNCVQAASEADNPNCWVTKGPVYYGTASYDEVSDTTTLTSDVDQTDYVYRDIALRNVQGHSLLLIALTQAEEDRYLTGLPYLYGYQITDSIYIEEYLHGQQTLFNGDAGQWDVSYGLYPVDSTTVTQLRYFFMQGRYAGTDYNNAAGLFRYPGVFIVDSEEQANEIIAQYSEVIAPVTVPADETPADEETVDEETIEDIAEPDSISPVDEIPIDETPADAEANDEEIVEDEETNVDITAPAEITLGVTRKDPWNKTITLNWTNPADTDFDHVQIERTDRYGTVVTLSTDVEGEQYIDNTITYRMTYTYTVFTVYTAGNVSAGVTTDPKKVRSPNIRHLRLREYDSAIIARWERLPLRRDPAVGYIVYYSTSPDALTNVIDVGNTRAVTISALVRGQLYYVAVAAYNGAGTAGPLSVIKSIQL